MKVNRRTFLSGLGATLLLPKPSFAAETLWSEGGQNPYANYQDLERVLAPFQENWFGLLPTQNAEIASAFMGRGDTGGNTALVEEYLQDGVYFDQMVFGNGQVLQGVQAVPSQWSRGQTLHMTTVIHATPSEIIYASIPHVCGNTAIRRNPGTMPCILPTGKNFVS